MSSPHYIHVGWLIDGSGGKTRNQVLLKIENHHIADILPYSADIELLPGQLTDLSDCTVLPPLVDSHAHLFMSASLDKKVRQRQLVDGYDKLRPVIAQHIQSLLDYGVLTVRDGGDRGRFALHFRDNEPIASTLTLVATGRAWHAAGRYGGLIGRSPGPGEELAEAYLRDGREGEQVKLVNSGFNSLTLYGHETKPQFSLEELQRVVKVAATDGRLVMVHANGREPVRRAILAGCHSIEHGFFMGVDNLQRMAERGTFWVPTVCTMLSFLENFDSIDHPADRLVIKRNLEHQLEQLSLAQEFGVNVAMGTDAGCLGVWHGKSMATEIGLYLQAGFSLEGAIHCATLQGARLLGLSSVGEVRKSRPATFLVSKGGPEKLPYALSSLAAIYVDGQKHCFTS